MKHFEDIWVEAEKVAEEFYSNHDEVQLELKMDLLTTLICSSKKHTSPENVGELLLILSFFTRKHNINVWPVLKEALDNAKIDLMENESVVENSDSRE